MDVQKCRHAHGFGAELVWCAVLVACIGARATFGAPSTRPAAATVPANAARLERLVGDLASAQSDSREAARLTLMGIGRENLDALREAVKKASGKNALSAAQVAALREIVIQVWLATEPYDANRHQGFLGVKDLRELVAVENKPRADPPDPPAAGEEQAVPAGGVIISDRIPGFCGFRYLQNGDVVQAVKLQSDVAIGDDHVIHIRSVGELQAVVKAHDPGDTITLRILRRGKVTDVTLQLSAWPDAAVDMFAMDEFRRAREAEADRYFKQVFAPLFDLGA